MRGDKGARDKGHGRWGTEGQGRRRWHILLIHFAMEAPFVVIILFIHHAWPLLFLLFHYMPFYPGAWYGLGTFWVVSLNLQSFVWMENCLLLRLDSLTQFAARGICCACHEGACMQQLPHVLQIDMGHSCSLNLLCNYTCPLRCGSIGERRFEPTTIPICPCSSVSIGYVNAAYTFYRILHRYCSRAGWQ